MTYTETVIPGVWIIEPKVLKDARGYFMEALSKRNSRRISEKSSSCKTTNLAPLKAYYEDYTIS